MSNSVVATYAAHRTAIATRTGGESGDWPDIAAALSTILLDRLGELPLERPLRNAWPYPVRRLNGDWPNLIVLHVRSVTTRQDAVWRQWRHDAQLILICGPWGDDPGGMQAMGTAYITPIVEVLDANQSLDGLCKHIELDPAGQTWQILSYGPSVAVPPPPQWYGLVTPVTVFGQSVRVRS